ncbi:WAP four-disulfide core domain protein 2 [Gracilinanus agilis]|uniref:WAP four-disulfide core domain protein 2 n=1 Tax=Gracilinanus agilis TaxID=191870 RepID=UPI001CFD78AA|nr:WAP four-disulfide core domain protein 2 [Gracilinanus agilis]XP_044519724.1 WAP four-disulfide core domain protein 2 [Gracilinanus agilis]XP_044519725.1 WAP four-disulfide core domain protein 2 [Gracilinanus agilis]XP_044519726.1 WAP four-disulfide core domain protein 2 [Gracilinanus agilis]XP_044519727.1 WAP four-disulfide core domain protein 2 [Gracilinanus agilis]XP_044519728.1 WAP four-disulfide core domain protein 2 [Gracilinanus agilis]
MARKLTPFLAFLGGLFLLFLLGLPPAFGQNSTSEYSDEENRPKGVESAGPSNTAGSVEGKVGVCPKLQEGDSCEVECTSDMDCSNNLKCCSAGCSSFCKIPNNKMGTCPQIDSSISQLGLCHDQCREDSECSDQLKCCLNGCAKMTCTTPRF